MQDRVETKTTNIYRATYFLCVGGELKKITGRSVAKNKREKLGYRNTWVFHLINVPINAIEAWNRGTARVNARLFEATRKRLKRVIRRQIG